MEQKREQKSSVMKLEDENTLLKEIQKTPTNSKSLGHHSLA